MNSVLPPLVQRGLPSLTRPAQNAYAATGWWLLGSGGLVLAMIHVGGVTRLTQSGLSMTTWSPLGSLPPLSHEEWVREFVRYQAFPEFEQRRSMTLSEFQYIYGWEYGHRMLGRFIGLFFCAPWLYFTLRGRIPPGYQPRLIGLATLGGTQGLVGWWMVKSGLGEDRRGDKREIRVQPTRLATHLSIAIATYGALIWTGLDVLGLNHSKTEITNQVSQLTREAVRHASKLRTGGIVLSALTLATVVSGALVAGNDAGRAFNTFPLMGGKIIPAEYGQLLPFYRNFVEDTATVQFNHRVLGAATAATAVALLTAGWRLRYTAFTPQARLGLYAIGAAATGQFWLGVATLLTFVPLPLAAAHQLGSIVVFTSSLYFTHALRYTRPVIVRSVKSFK